MGEFYSQRIHRPVDRTAAIGMMRVQSRPIAAVTPDRVVMVEGEETAGAAATKFMNSMNMAIVWVCVVVGFLIIMFFAARDGNAAPGDNVAKQPDKKSPPPDAAQPQPSSADPHP